MKKKVAQAVAVALRFHDVAVVLYIAAVDFPAVVIAETVSYTHLVMCCVTVS